MVRTSGRVIYLAIRQWLANQDLRWGAALAYYALFSIAPLLVIAVEIAAIVYGEEAARGRLEHELTEWIGAEPAQAIQTLLSQAQHSRHTSWAPLISYGFLLIAALGVFLHLRTAFCYIWKLEPPACHSLLAMLLDYALALIMVLCMGLFLLASLTAAVTVQALRAYLGDELPFGGQIFQWLEMGASFALLSLLFAFTYRVLSGRRISWGFVLYGSLIAALLFTAGKVLLSYYLVFAGTASAYGAAGSAAVFLVWVYYSSQVLFFGAELIQARRRVIEGTA
jgi:membrane protein